MSKTSKLMTIETIGRFSAKEKELIREKIYDAISSTFIEYKRRESLGKTDFRKLYLKRYEYWAKI